MINEERLLKVLIMPHISEKSSYTMKKNNTVVLKVLRNATKFEIKTAIQYLFRVTVKKVNTLIIKGKRKKQKNVFFKRSNWKKAYVVLKTGQNLNFMSLN
ncbi:50S ribosomal protein L23 [Buchnera aphidicola]|uniref:Large ribosomal subunit protein uL23 n=1 Tax=Buchnera aphidicola subsp. Tuberolachnus salignus TaxID=98804 RepID=A0A161K9T2_BUCTT|nr:50S ribosomal protein L23 [Buchnera aphidicola]CUR53319.1 50S ribosomal protein L23 [Buchnera aphidicola (Tuberolachnus salignus)]